MEEADWKEELLKVLRATGLINEGYSGRVVINLNQGGVTDVEKVEKLESAPE